MNAGEQKDKSLTDCQISFPVLRRKQNRKKTTKKHNNNNKT